MSDKDALRGTMECPICGWPEPHAHTPEEIAERPAIDWARTTFENAAHDFMAQRYFKPIRTGFWWADSAEDARKRDFGWSTRNGPIGPYLNEFVEQMWRLWRMAWLAARGNYSQRPAPPADALELARLDAFGDSNRPDAAQRYAKRILAEPDFNTDAASWKRIAIKMAQALLAARPQESAGAESIQQRLYTLFHRVGDLLDVNGQLDHKQVEIFDDIRAARVDDRWLSDVVNAWRMVRLAVQDDIAARLSAEGGERG